MCLYDRRRGLKAVFALIRWEIELIKQKVKTTINPRSCR